MTSRERLLTALRRGTPDRVPMPLRIWKFLRRHDARTADAPDRQLPAQAEFCNDIWHYGASPMLPCFSPVGAPWRDDVTVGLRHQRS